MSHRIFNFILIIANLFFLWNVARADGYCLAIRGNGELAPAHWGAVASVVEKSGFPVAQAGGSSASITMFLLDAMSQNSYLQKDKNKSALLLKSLQGVVEYLSQTQEWKKFSLLYGQAMQVAQGKEFFLQTLEAQLHQSNVLDTSKAKEWYQHYSVVVSENLNIAEKLGLIDPAIRIRLMNALIALQASTTKTDAQKQLQIIGFYAQELQNSIRVFGKFDAESDVNLFFRPGIVNFDILADQFGKIAQFYTAVSINKNIQSDWSQFLDQCSSVSLGKTWDEMKAINPSCPLSFYSLLKSYFSQATEVMGNFASQNVGVSIASYPTTAVLTRSSYLKHKPLERESSYDQAERSLEEYHQSMDLDFGKNFKIESPDSVKFGYWGAPDRLASIQKNLPKNDEKSLRFEALGETTWKTVLSLSPAEPGLSPLKKFFAQGQPMISAGGWSDLHPVTVLKAAGCEKVVYITRRGGESLFGQGVAKRLLGEDAQWGKDWDDLRTQPEDVGQQNWVKNNKGDLSDMTSLWSRLYNIANPNSSIQKSLQNADAVLCTNWNEFDVKKQLSELIADAYRSPYYVSPSATVSHFEAYQPRLQTQDVNRKGYLEYVGCFPQVE